MLGRFLAGLIIILIVIAALPWIDGYIFKTRYLELIDILNRESKFNITVLEYDLGWLHSKAQVQITLKEAPTNRPISMNGFILEEIISHGPIVFDNVNNKRYFAFSNVQTVFHLPDPIESLILGSKKTNGIMQISSINTFQNSWLNHISIPPINTTLPAVGTFTWDGLEGDIYLHIYGGTVNGFKSTITSGGFSLTNNATPNIGFKQVMVQPVIVINNATKLANGLWSGNKQMSINGDLAKHLPAISIFKMDGVNVTVDSLKLQSTYGITGDNNYNSSVQLNLEDLKIPDAVISQVLNLNLNIAANNFSAKGLMLLLQYANALRTIPSMQNDVEQEKQILNQIFLPNSRVTFELLTATNLGNITAQGKISIAPGVATAASTSEILNHINYEVNIKVATTLVNKMIDQYADIFNASIVMTNPTAPNMSAASDLTTVSPSVNPAQLVYQKIADWVKQGFIIQEGSEYVINVTQSAGVMKLNGHEFTPQMLMTPSPANNAPIPLTPAVVVPH